MAELELLSVVALIEDLPKQQLQRRQVDTVVENLASGVYEVDFCDDNGQTYASVAVSGNKLLRLHHEPNQHADQLTAYKLGTVT